MKEAELATRRPGIGLLLIGAILLWAFVFRDKAKNSEVPPSGGEFAELSVTAIPSGVEQSPQRLVQVGDTVGLAGGTVQYRGAAKTWRFHCVLYQGDSLVAYRGNSVNFNTPLAMDWVTVSLPEVAMTVDASWGPATYEGIGAISDPAVTPPTFIIQSARVPAYQIQVPEATWLALSLSWI